MTSYRGFGCWLIRRPSSCRIVTLNSPHIASPTSLMEAGQKLGFPVSFRETEALAGLTA